MKKNNEKIPRTIDEAGNPILNKKKKPSKKEMVIVLVPTIIVAILIGVFLYGNDKAKSFVLEEEYSQHYVGGTYKVDKGTTYKKTGEGQTIVIRNNEAVETSSLILYSDENSKIFLPTDFIYYGAQDHNCYLVPAFSEISWDLKYNTKLSYQKKSCNLTKGFLYDGEDYYIVLEDCVLDYDGFQMNLSKYSYVEVGRGTDLVAYDRQSGECVSRSIEDEATLSNGEGGFTINLRNDSIVLYDGTKMLLFSRPSLLDEIYKEVK